MYLCLIFSKVDSQDALVLLDYLDYCDYLDYQKSIYESIATVGEIRVWWRADFQSGSRVLKKVF